MDFLSEVLCSAGEVLKLELTELTANICHRIETLKHEVKEAMEQSYVHFLPFMNENKSLISEATTLVDEMRDLQERLEDKTKEEVYGLNTELKSLKESLQEATLSIEIINKFVAIENCIARAKNEHSSRNYDTVAESLLELNNLLKQETSNIELLDIHKGLVVFLNSWESQFLIETSREWQEYLEWEILNLEEKYKNVSLKVGSNLNQGKGLIRALHFYNEDKKEIKLFSENLMNELLKPILLFTTTSHVQVGKCVVLKLDVDLKSKKTNFENVMKNLTVVFEFLKNYLMLDISESKTFLGSVGHIVSSEFLKLFVEECLSDTIPSKRNELSSYNKTTNQIREFQLNLQTMGFVTDGSDHLKCFYDNLDELFANKTMERYLATARELMKKDLLEIKEVGILPVEEVREKSIDEKLELTEISPNLFRFPVCKISKSIDEILSLVREILDEVIKTKDNLAINLYFTSRNIFTMFIETVPMHHRKLLESIPIVAAILHNNFMYLAHKLMTLDLEYKRHYPSILSKYLTGYVDFVSPMRSKAVFILKEQVEKQNELISSIIKNSGLSSLGNQEAFHPKIEKSIHQCLRQLSLLQSVWMSILPSNVYCNLIAYLVGNFIEDLIVRVIFTKDILADTATELVKLFTLIKNKIPLIFPVPKEAQLLVKNWTRFIELIQVLGGSLLDISERWADGKGPLAQEFTPEQVKQLIRALFQVSDRRAAVLAKIV